MLLCLPLLTNFLKVAQLLVVIESSHLKPSKIGDVVRAVAEVTKVDGKKIEFKVSAYSGDVLLGEGTHLRFIVDREKFMSKFQ